MDKLCYSFLPKNNQSLYGVIEDALFHNKNGIPVKSQYSNDDIRDTIEAVCYDNPDIISINKTIYRIVSSFTSKQVNFRYIASQGESTKRNQLLKAKLDEAVFEIDSKAKSDRETLQGISEYLQRNVIYDMDELQSVGAGGASKRPDSHNAFGALVNGLAVCDGFSSAFALIAREFGFNVMIISGTSNHFGSSSIDHAWNIVEFEGKYYHIDATWDEGNYQDCQEYPYFYFGLSDEEIAIDHDWDYHKTPPCDDTALSYYEYNHLLASSMDQVENIIAREIRQGKNAIRMKLSPKVVVPDDNGAFLGKKVASIGATIMNGRIEYRYMWNEPTRCFIAILK